MLTEQQRKEHNLHATGAPTENDIGNLLNRCAAIASAAAEAREILKAAGRTQDLAAARGVIIYAESMCKALHELLQLRIRVWLAGQGIGLDTRPAKLDNPGMKDGQT